jgi:hypothetical protein
LNRAEKAKATLDNDFIKSAINEIREACYKNISLSAHDQADLREDLYYMLRAVAAFERVLQHHIREGKVDDLNELNIKRIMR